jgi:hypothetical protein
VLAVALALVRTLSSRHPSLERRLPLFLTTDKVGILARRPSRKTIGESVIPGRPVSVNPLAAALSSASAPHSALLVSRDGVPLRSNPMLLARTNSSAGTGSSSTRPAHGDAVGRRRMQVRHAAPASDVRKAQDTTVALVDRVRFLRRPGSRPPPPPLPYDGDGDGAGGAGGSAGEAWSAPGEAVSPGSQP